MNNNSKILLEKLYSLSKNSGFLGFSIGDYYVQFLKEKSEDYITFEALSHYFDDNVPKKLNKEFSKLNFKIDAGNYYKTVWVSDVETIVNDVQRIFEKIYKVNYEKEFLITDEIEYFNKGKKISNLQKQNTINQVQTYPLKVIIVVGVSVFLLYWLFFSKDEKKYDDLKSEACIISQQFVKRQLVSPKSADFGFCDDSKIVYLGNNRYQVTNYVDAANAFGTSLRKTYFIILRYNEGEWADINNWSLETIEIN